MSSAGLSFEALDGQFVLLPAYAYQNLWQALNMLEDRLQDAEEPSLMDTSKDEELGEMHSKLMLAALTVRNIPTGIDVVLDVQKNNQRSVPCRKAA